MTVEQILGGYDDGKIAQEQACRGLLALGYSKDRVTACLQMMDQAKAEDEALGEKMMNLLRRKATAADWRRELGPDYGHAVYLMQQLAEKGRV